MENMTIYNALRSVPNNAQKPIQAGRLKGMTDINPMWRIKALTEQFGPCGIGWNLINQKMQLIPVEGMGEILCIYEVDLIYKENGEWSAPVHGIGGNKIAVKETKGLYADDEGVKKAYTDAIGSACKMIGCAADVYWDKDTTKYDVVVHGMEQVAQKQPDKAQIAPRWSAKAEIEAFCMANSMTKSAFAAYRMAVISGGIVPDIPSAELDKEQCEALLKAIRDNLVAA